MLITKEQQEAWVNNYVKDKHTQEECVGFIDGVEKVVSVLDLEKKELADVISNFSGNNLLKLQNHFVKLYGKDEVAGEKGVSFAVGFDKACELMIKELSKLL